MKRMFVVRNKDGSVSCLPVSSGNWKRYNNIITFINKPWNPYYVERIKNYFKGR